MMDRKLPLHLILIFLLGFFFISASFAGLPADFSDDYLKSIQSAKSLSYLEVVWLVLNPFTPTWFYPPTSAEMIYVRPLVYLLFKLYFAWFGYGLLPFHITAAVGFGLLSMVFFVLVFLTTRSLLLGWLAVILYASFPSNFFLMASEYSMDFQYYVSILSIAALTLFGLLTFQKGRARKSFFLGLLRWTFVTWLAIKMKPSEKILPFICLGFLILRFRFILSRIGWSRQILLVLTIIAMMTLVVPLRPFEEWTKTSVTRGGQSSVRPVTDKDQVTFSFSWKNLIQRTFFIPGGEFPFLTVHRRKSPRSFTENYSFFLGWLFWGGLLSVPFVLARFRNRAQKTGGVNIDFDLEGYWHAFTLVLVWFGFVILGFSSGNVVTDVRLVNFGYVPSVLLFFWMAGVTERCLLQDPQRARWFRYLLVVLLVYTSLTNFGFFSKLLIHFGGIQDAYLRAEKDIYTAVYGEVPKGELTLYEYHNELHNRAVVIDWYELPEDWFQQARGMLRREKRIFFYARSPDSERLRRFREAGFQVTLWRRYDFFDAKPLAFRFSRRIEQFKSLWKKRKRREIIVYLIEEGQPISR